MPAIETVTNNTVLEVTIPGPQGPVGPTPDPVSQAVAVAGTENTGLMTPLRTHQSIAANQRRRSVLMAIT